MNIEAAEINQTDSKGFKQGYWKLYLEDRYTMAEGNYVDGLRHGSWKWYWHTSMILSSDYYVSGVIEGECIMYV